MEEKLREFKNRRRREEFINKNKELLRSVMEKVTFRSPSPAFSDTSDVNQPLIETNLSSPKSPLVSTINQTTIFLFHDGHVVINFLTLQPVA